ncbi:MAG: plastocyanin, partial [Actinobacteria bacterium]
MGRTSWKKLLVSSLLVGFVPTASAAPATVIRVPQDAPTVQVAVDAAAPGDTILLDRGTYAGGVVVPKDKPNLTIRGVDRNAVV